MIQIYKKRYCTYMLLITIFWFINFFYKPKPKLSKIILKNQYTSLLDKNNSEIDLVSNDNRVNIGKPYYLINKTDWYQINLLSFWRKEYLDLALLDKRLKFEDTKIEIRDKNNYAQGFYNNRKIVYACVNNPKDFFYKFDHNNVRSTSNFNYWKKVFINNIKFTFNFFKPINYQCLLVITSDIDLFEKDEKEINEKIFGKFIF